MVSICRVKRANQSYIFSILLADELIPAPIFYGTIVPVIAFFSFKTFILNPYHQREKEKEMQKNRQSSLSKLNEQKKEAEAAVSLMNETYQRIVAQETQRAGLVIIKATYGNKKLISQIKSVQDKKEPNPEIFDVTIPIQCLVKNGYLYISSCSKVSFN